MERKEIAYEKFLDAGVMTEHTGKTVLQLLLDANISSVHENEKINKLDNLR